MAFGLLSIGYNVVLFIIMLQCFICMGEIQTSKMDLISQIYQIMIVNMLITEVVNIIVTILSNL